MADIIKAYALVGEFRYRSEPHEPRGGNMSGTALMDDHGNFVGVMRDKDHHLIDSGNLKYMFGRFHKDENISLLKIAPAESNLKPVCWSFKPNYEKESFSGGWVFLETTLETIVLSSFSYLQDFASLDINNFWILNELQSKATSQIKF